MLNNKKLFGLFLPAILILLLMLGIRFEQYRAGKEKPETAEPLVAGFEIPVSPSDPILGEKSAPKTIIAFEDLGCPQCKAQATLFDALEEKHPGKVKVIWKTLTVTRFPFNTKTAHRYGFCAHTQGKFDEFKRVAFANSSNLSDQVVQTIAEQVELDQNKLGRCLEGTAPDAYLATTEQLARSLDIQAVPALFVENRQVVAPPTVEGWETLLGL